MRCGQVRKDLPLYLDHRLSERRSAGVETHLGECRRCRAELEDLRAVVETVRSLPALKTPAGFHRAVVAALRQAQYEHQRGSLASRSMRVLRPALVVAGVALAIGVSVHLLGRTPSSHAPERVAAIDAADSTLRAVEPERTVVEREARTEPTPETAAVRSPVPKPFEPRTPTRKRRAPAVVVATRPRAVKREGPPEPPKPPETATTPTAEPEAPEVSEEGMTFAAYLLGSLVVQQAAVEPEMADPDVTRDLVVTTWPAEPGIIVAADGGLLTAELPSEAYN
ncbi:MAG: anti-sigma factor family protein [Armatimonadota bacterium]